MSRRRDEQSTTAATDTATAVLNDLSSLILNLIRPPLPRPMMLRTRPPPTLPPLSLFGFASLLLGMSLSLMLCGSVTFFIGFMLIPCVIGLFTLFYVVGMVCTLSMFGRAVLGLAVPPSFSSKDDVPVWKLW